MTVLAYPMPQAWGYPWYSQRGPPDQCGGACVYAMPFPCFPCGPMPAHLECNQAPATEDLLSMTEQGGGKNAPGNEETTSDEYQQGAGTNATKRRTTSDEWTHQGGEMNDSSGRPTSEEWTHHEAGTTSEESKKGAGKAKRPLGAAPGNFNIPSKINIHSKLTEGLIPGFPPPPAYNEISLSRATTRASETSTAEEDGIPTEERGIPCEEQGRPCDGAQTPRTPRSILKMQMIHHVYEGEDITQAVMKMIEREPDSVSVIENKPPPNRKNEIKNSEKPPTKEKEDEKENSTSDSTYHASDMVQDFLDRDLPQDDEGNIDKVLLQKYQNEISQVFDWIKPHILSVSKGSRSGSLVVQKLLDCDGITDEQRKIVALAFQNNVWECAKNQHANFVLQKIIEKLGSSAGNVGSVSINFILNELAAPDPNPLPENYQKVQRRNSPVQYSHGDGYVHAARNRYGCRVLERLIEHASDEQIKPVIDKLIEACPCVYGENLDTGLNAHAYGNYVIKHILERGTHKQCRDIVVQVIADFDYLATHRIGGYTVANAVTLAEETLLLYSMLQMPKNQWPENWVMSVNGPPKPRLPMDVIEMLRNKFFEPKTVAERGIFFGQCFENLVEMSRDQYGNKTAEHFLKAPNISGGPATSYRLLDRQQPYYNRLYLHGTKHSKGFVERIYEEFHGKRMPKDQVQGQRAPNALPYAQHQRQLQTKTSEP